MIEIFNVSLTSWSIFSPSSRPCPLNDSIDVLLALSNDVLKIKGKKVKNEKDFLYKGIGERSFEQTFKLAEFTEVDKVKLEDGVLNVSLIQDLPEEKKEKTIKIS